MDKRFKRKFKLTQKIVLVMILRGDKILVGYTYTNPLDQGYKQFKLTKKQHNQLFKYRQIKWTDRYEYYYNDNEILLHRFGNKLIVILETILFPVTILLNGVRNCDECWNALKSLYNQKESGSFSADSAGYGSNTYNEVMEIIRKEK